MQMQDEFNGLTLEDALHAAINVLRDSAESGRMPSGESLSSAAADAHRDAHRDAAERLQEELRYLTESVPGAKRRAIR